MTLKVEPIDLCDDCGHRHFNMDWGEYEDCPTCTYGCEKDGSVE